MLEFEPPERNTPAAIQFRKDWCITSLGWLCEECIYIDETGFNLHNFRRKGRSVKGQKAIVVRPSSQGANISICAAISYRHGVMHWMMVTGFFNKELYIEFFTDLMKHHAFTQRSHRLIMDNARFHHCQNLKDLIEGLPIRQYLTYLPPYSPHLNAIEYCFSAWHSQVNQGEKKEATIKEKIKEAIDNTNVEKCSAYYREVERYRGMCAAGRILRYEPPRSLFF